METYNKILNILFVFDLALLLYYPYNSFLQLADDYFLFLVQATRFVLLHIIFLKVVYYIMKYNEYRKRKALRQGKSR